MALLLADPRTDPSADSGAAFSCAASYGGAFWTAASPGHTEAAALLLADPRTDPAVLDLPRFADFCARPPVAAALAARRRWSALRAAWAGAVAAAAHAHARADADASLADAALAGC
jgi:hypothetical protein